MIPKTRIDLNKLYLKGAKRLFIENKWIVKFMDMVLTKLTIPIYN